MNFEVSLIAKTTGILAVVSLVCMALRKASASTLHAIWAVGLVAVLAFPVAAAFLPSIDVPILPNEEPEVSVGPTQPTTVTSISESGALTPLQTPATSATVDPATVAAPQLAWTWREGLRLLWGLGSCVVFGGWLFALWELNRAKRNSATVTAPEWCDLLADLQRKLDVGTPVHLRISRTTVPPMTWGILRPVILLPSDAKEWTEERRRLVLAHELGHVKRNDGLGQLLCQCVSAIYWFNPLVWFAVHRLRAERERACDDIVLRLGAAPADYADHLLQIARRMNAGFSWTVVSMANPSQLKARLVAILDPGMRRQRLSRAAAAALTLIVITLTASTAVIQLTALASMSVRGFMAAVPPPAPPLELVAQQARPPVSVTPATATVEGKVQKVGGGDLIAGAAVELRPSFDRDRILNDPAALARALASGTDPAEEGVLIAVTDEKGSFVFNNVPPGEYSLAATQAGYVRSEYGQKRPNGPGARFTLQAGEDLKGIVLSMEGTAVISGQIRGLKGLALANVQVHALRYGYEDGRRVLKVVRVVRTNDEGDYRLYWLPPGQYIVMAMPLLGGIEETLIIVGSDGTARGFGAIRPPNGAPIVLPEESGNVPFYYPGTVRLDGATVITLKSSEQRTGINLGMTPLPVVHVRGVLTNLPPIAGGNAAGPPTRATVRLEPTTPSVLERGSAPLGMGAIDLQTGSFDIRGVLPGTYHLVATASGGGRNQSALFARVPLEVGGGDINDLRVPLAPGFSLTVRVSVEGATDGSEVTKLLPLRIALNGRVAQPDPTQPAGVFVVNDLPPAVYRMQVEGLRSGYVKEARYGGLDILDSGLTLDSVPGSPVDITIAPGAGTISGMSMTREGKRVSNAAVVLVPNADRRGVARLYKNVLSAADGTFRITGITPGDYKLFSWSDVDTGAWQDPDFIKDYEDQGRPIQIGKGTAATVEVIAQ